MHPLLLTLTLIPGGSQPAVAHVGTAPVTATPQLTENPLLALLGYRRRSYARPSWGAPRWSYGGAARGGCAPGEPPVVPLVPVDSQDPASPAFLGVTAAAYPSLLVYVPPTTAPAVELLVIDENQDQPETAGTVIYQKQIGLSQSPGIVKFDLRAAQVANEAVAPLTIGRHYTWTVSLVCDPLDPSGNPFVNGLIQRLPAPDLPADTDPYDRISHYAAAGLWHETIATLGDLHCQSPPSTETVATDWRNLLLSLNLTDIPELLSTVQSQDIADAPLLWCE